MSWLVAVSFPGLLMVFTVGLQRVESLLHGDRPSAVEWVARLERAARTARHKAAQRAMSDVSAAGRSHRLDPVLLIDEPGLPTRPNPLFQQSGLGNRV